MPHNYSSEYLREIAAKVIINEPRYSDLTKNQSDTINSLQMWLDCCCELPGLDGAKWRQVRHFIATNAPGLLNRTPVPDSFLRRAREVNEETARAGLVQPPLPKQATL